MPRLHLLGIDDGPFHKHQREPVPIVGVLMEGCDRVECVAMTEFPVDGAKATSFLADWVRSLRLEPTVQGIVLGGITIAGLGIVDVRGLAETLATPVFVVTRRDPANHRVAEALRAAGLSDREALLEAAPPAVRLESGLYLAWAGSERAAAEAAIRGALGKSKLPEPLRVAHLIAAARVRGESRGRV